MYLKRCFFGVMILTLAGCGPTPPVPASVLKEELADKSPDERKTILKAACLNEATWARHRHSEKAGYAALCEEMYMDME